MDGAQVGPGSEQPGEGQRPRAQAASGGIGQGDRTSKQLVGAGARKAASAARGARVAASFTPAGYPLRYGPPWRWAIVTAMAAAVGLRFGVTWSTPGLMVWGAGLAMLAVSDLERMILPKRLVYATLAVTVGWLVLAAGMHGSWGRLGGALLAAAVAEGLFAGVALTRPESLGFGDVRLVGLIGLGVGWVGPWLVAVGVAAGVMAAGVVA